MNPIQDRLRIAVRGALNEAHASSNLEHPGLIGTVREIMVERILKPVLTPEINFGTGKLVDSRGNLSNELDVILYSPQILPPGLYDKRMGIFPAESCLYAVEVKSKLTKVEIEKSMDGAAKVKKLFYLPTSYHNGMKTQMSPIPMPICAIFAFGSDLKGDEMKELDRLRNMPCSPPKNPLISVLCVVGRGYWYYHRKGWHHSPATKDHDEILSYMAGISNTIPGFLVAKGQPRFGNYLQKDNPMRVPD